MSEKKIGLCVCYDTKNYGSQLQVLATQEMVSRLGYVPEIIRYKKKMSLTFLAQSLPRMLNPHFVSSKLRSRKKRRQLSRDPQIAENVRLRNRRFEAFVDTHFSTLSRPYLGWKDLKKGAGEAYDAFLCGSDQLWLPQNLGSHFYTLEFAPANKPKIAYATSFGVRQIPWYQKKRTANYLSRFQKLSVRELRGAEMVRELTGLTAKVVCDPTLLFDRQQWAQLLPPKEPLQEEYIFCYFLGTNPEHRKAAEQLSEQMGLPIVTCPYLDHFVEGDKQFGQLQLFDADAADFVDLIRNARYILTDSFHGTVFSLIHHKQFLTFNRFDEGANSRNSRIDSLCALLDIRQRRYSGDVQAVTAELDYSAVDEKLSDLRAESIAYLQETLSLSK